MIDIPQIEQPAPNFIAKDQNGNIVSLKDNFGDRPLVLYFYPKDN